MTLESSNFARAVSEPGAVATGSSDHTDEKELAASSTSPRVSLDLVATAPGSDTSKAALAMFSSFQAGRFANNGLDNLDLLQ